MRKAGEEVRRITNLGRISVQRDRLVDHKWQEH
jgi:hypothetical protein